jgi:hypothetical protein
MDHTFAEVLYHIKMIMSLLLKLTKLCSDLIAYAFGNKFISKIAYEIIEIKGPVTT